MTFQPLSPAQALWQHYGVTAPANTASRVNPVQHKDTYARLHAVGRRSSPTLPAVNRQSSGKWQPAIKRETADEGLGLSEL